VKEAGWARGGYSVRANSAHIRESRPYSGLGLQVKVLKLLYGVPYSYRGADGLDVVDEALGSGDSSGVSKLQSS